MGGSKKGEEKSHTRSKPLMTVFISAMCYRVLIFDASTDNKRSETRGRYSYRNAKTHAKNLAEVPTFTYLLYVYPY